MLKKRRQLVASPMAVGVLTSGVLALSPLPAFALDHQHVGLDALLKRHVAWNSAGTASSVDYRALAAQRAELKKVLDEYSAVTRSQYDGFRKEQKLAFLINAYNAFTLELILTKYPDLKSIKDLGSVLQAPWKKKFFKLLGEDRHLDYIEHEVIRAPGVFDEPRIHFAVVCASIGCPALRPEAFTADRLEQQLEDGAKRFLSDTSRNRVNARAGKLEVSKIFDWYRGDFEKGHKGIQSREQFFGRYADVLSKQAETQALIKEGKLGLSFLDYDWNLNDKR
jgi:hypothetical protein